MRRSVLHSAVTLFVVSNLVALLPASVQRAAAGETKTVTPTLPAEWVKALRWRCIGPANMGGRISDIAVYEKDPCIWWAATASGGLLKTTNNGITFEHQFDRESTVSIGAVAVAQSDPNIVWVGTGESNPRNSVSWGDGVYKSTDGGQTWKHMGLRESFQIGRIAIHPTEPDIVYVGALGRLWGSNQQRGLFKTTDGGQTWEKVLYVDERTGVIDVQMRPQDPDTLLVATYERQRDEYDSNDPAKKRGPGSGLYQTTDAGQTWKKLTQGLPQGMLGRIGIDYYRADPNTVYVVLESESIGKEPEDAPHAGIRGEDAQVGARLTEITKNGPAEKAELKRDDIVVSVDGVTVHSYEDLIKQIRRHLAGDTVKLEVSRDRKSVFVELTFEKRPKPSGQGGRRQRPPFSSGLGGQRENVQQQQGPSGHEFGGVYRSTDGGESWTRINSVNPRPMYFSQIRVDPSDDNHLWVLGINLHVSKDGGETFTGDGARDAHVDHHAMWIDPRDGRHAILGTDGGVYITHDRGKHWDRLNHAAIGQFYHAAVDSRRNYNVYGGLQDNGSWGGPSRVRSGRGPVNADWFMLGWGDGFVCRVDRDDPDQVYFESQNGGMGRYNLRTAERGFLRPRGQGPARYRFNWKTPYILSHHNSRILYAAGNYVFRSLNRGDKLQIISPDITRTEKGAATALAESPRDASVLYVGTDDGLLWVTRNGGHDWSRLVKFRAEDSAWSKITDAGRAAWRKLTGASEEDSRRPGRPVPATRPASRPSTQPATRSTTQPASEPSTQPATRPTTQPASQPNAQPATQPSTQPASRPSIKPATRPTTQPVTRPTRPDPGSRGARMIENLMRFDTNGDGKLQKNEAPPRMSRMFDRADNNSDGALDADELKAFGQRMRGTRGRGGRGRREPPGDDAPPVGTQPTSRPALQRSSAGPPSPASGTDARPPGPAPATEDPVSGEWSARMVGDEMSEGQPEFSFTLKLAPDGEVTGINRSVMGENEISEGRYDPRTGKLTLAVVTDEMAVDFSATVGESSMTGVGDVGGGMFTFEFEADRTQAGLAAGPTAAVGQPQAGPEEHDWRPLTEWLPGPRRVSSIEASLVADGRVYITLDGHRSDDDEPYVFVSEDYGDTWRLLRANLPTSAGSTRVLREDLENPDLLYLGTEFGAWVSVDRGGSWTKFHSNLPTVAVHEFAIHPTAGEIVAATHGRSLWILDVTPLRQMTRQALGAPAHLYQPNTAIYWRSGPSRGGGGTRYYVGENPPSGAQILYSLNAQANRISLKITDLAGETIRELEADPSPGLHHVSWDLRRAPAEGRRAPREGRRGPGRGRGRRRGRPVPAGKYIVSLTVDRQTLTQELLVETDPDYPDHKAWEQEQLELESPGPDYGIRHSD